MSKTQTNGTRETRRQREPLVTCKKCKHKVDPKNTILCTSCNNNFEYDCIRYSEKLHRLKDPAARKNWQCKFCVQKTKVSLAPCSQASPVASTSKKADLPVESEITVDDQRRETNNKCKYQVNIPTNNSFRSLSDEEALDQTPSSLISRLNSSCPDICQINLKEKIEDLENRNKYLQEKLEIAESEIDNLLLKNSELNKILSKHENKAKYLADIINHSSSKKNITMRNKRKSLQRTQLDFSIDGDFKVDISDRNYENSTPAPTGDLEANHLQNMNNSSANCTEEKLQGTQPLDVTGGESAPITKPVTKPNI